MSRRLRGCRVCGAHPFPRRTWRPPGPTVVHLVLTQRPDLAHMTAVGARLAEAHLESA